MLEQPAQTGKTEIIIIDGPVVDGEIERDRPVEVTPNCSVNRNQGTQMPGSASRIGQAKQQWTNIRAGIRSEVEDGASFTVIIGKKYRQGLVIEGLCVHQGFVWWLQVGRATGAKGAFGVFDA